MVSFRRRPWPAALAPLFAALALACAGPVSAQQPTPTPSGPQIGKLFPALSAEQYRRELQDIRDTLGRMEKKPPRHAGPILNRLKRYTAVRREDGAIQKVTDDYWERVSEGLTTYTGAGRALPVPAKTANDASREVITDLRRAVDERIKGLDDWTTKRDGAYYKEANAQAIVAQLESSGQIRTGPTELQLLWKRMTQGIADMMESLGKWLNGLFPKTAPNAPNFDTRWLQYLFYGAVAGLLAVILWLIWKQIGGRWRRTDTRNELDLLGEDAELLQLPPDELRDRAQRYADEGNFREALRHRYLSMLLTLDARGVWRHDVRRTNWEHISLLRKREELRHLIGPLSEITRRFDRVRYGGAECSRPEWERFDADVKSVEARTGEVTSVR